MFPWLKYDLESFRILKRFGKKWQDDMLNGRYIIEMFEITAAKRRNHPMIIFEDREYSWDFMNEQANKVANIVMQWGLKVGDVVAIFVENSPEFVWLFLGRWYIDICVNILSYLWFHLDINIEMNLKSKKYYYMYYYRM